ncbi:MAG: hypothetical protein P1V81_06205 [Planctomycetota bacterium]|nr:hypothetical protein [Planctomycetota bacterium]
MQAPKSLLAIAAATLLCLPGSAQDSRPADAPAAPVALATTATPGTSVPAAMKVLVPDDATIFAMTSPLSELERVVASIAEDVNPDMAGMVSVDMLLQLAMPPGFDGSAIDRSRPVGVAVGPISMAAEPQIYALIPTANPDAIKAALPGGAERYATRVSDGYIGVTMGLAYGNSTGASSLLQNMPAGLITVNVDMETLLTDFRPMIDFGLQMARMQMESASEEINAASGYPGMDIVEMMEVYFGMLDGFLDSVVEMRMSLDIQETLLDMRVEYAVGEGSPMSSFAGTGDLDLDRFLPLLGNESFAMLMGADMGELMEKSMPFMEAIFDTYPQPMGDGLRESMDSMQSLYSMFGTGMAASGDFTDKGLTFAAYFDGAQYDQLMVEYDKMLKAPYMAAMGMHYVDTKKGRLGEIELTRYTFDYDVATLLGMTGEELDEASMAEMEAVLRAMYGEQMVTTFAKSGDMAVLTLGGGDEYLQEAIGRLDNPTRVPEDMQRLAGLAKTTNPFMAYRMDLGKLITTMIPMLESNLGAPSSGMEMFEGTSLPMNMYFGASPKSWTGGFMVDLVQVNDFVAMMETLGDL